MPPDPVIERSTLRGREHVFRDRADAGRILAEMLEAYEGCDGSVVAVPAGGVPVAVEVAHRLRLPLELAVVSKITLPWNTEAGYGAVAFDGTMLLNDDMIVRLGLRPEQVDAGVARTRSKVQRRCGELSADRPPAVSARTAIVVDDGVASGYTLRVALHALRRLAPAALVVAVPTGHRGALKAIGPAADAVYCANVRGDLMYAVADAYENWSDVSDAEVREILQTAGAPAKSE